MNPPTRPSGEDSEIRVPAFAVKTPSSLYLLCIALLGTSGVVKTVGEEVRFTQQLLSWSPAAGNQYLSSRPLHPVLGTQTRSSEDSQETAGSKSHQSNSGHIKCICVCGSNPDPTHPGSS
ncbi:uncharacterized protein LOC144306263 [Canis aureus]